MMNQNSSQRSITPGRTCKFKADELSEVTRLLTHIEQTAIDSENAPIHTDEVLSTANLVVERLVWGNQNLQQVIQEALDDLRFGL